MIMMVMMSRAIKKNDQFWREVSDVRKRLRGSPGGGGEGSDQYCMCLKTSISDNCQSRTKVNAMVILKMCGWEGFILYATNMVTMMMIILLSIGDDGNAVIDITGMRNNTVMKTWC